MHQLELYSAKSGVNPTFITLIIRFNDAFKLKVEYLIMSLSVGHGFLTSDISNSTIDKMQHADSPPHLSCWEKIKDFFFSTHQEEALKLLFKLFHPEDKTTSQDIKDTWEQLKQFASTGYETCFGTTDSNPDHNHFTIEGASLTITIDNQENKCTIANGDIESRFTYNLYKPEKAVNILPPNETGSNTSVKTPTKIDEISAKKIQKYYSNFKKNLKERESQNEEFTKVAYDGDKNNIKGRTYYLSKNHSPVYKASEGIPYNENEAGSFKHVTHKDQRFVALAPNKSDVKFNTTNDVSHFKGLNSMKFGLAVSPELIIARNSGDDLFNCLSKNVSLPLLAFKNAVNDLKQLHERGVFLRDIKLENLTYDGKQVNFIDVDDRLGIHKEVGTSTIRFDIYGSEVMFTDEYITTSLINNIYITRDGKRELIDKDITQFLQVADEYAFLIAIIEATTYNESFNVAAEGRKPIFKNYINSRDKKHAISWVKENIKHEYIESVKSLLTNPGLYAEQTQKYHLADMLLFGNK